MPNFFSTLKDRAAAAPAQVTPASARPQAFQVMVPNAVVLPLPKAPRDEICVPASINGRDLSTGRL